MAKQDFDAFFKGINDEIRSTAESIEQAAMFEAVLQVAEVWANDIIHLLTKKEVKPALSSETIERRKRSGLFVADVDTPLIETGLFLESIEVLVTSYPDSGVYYVDVGISDDSTQEVRSKVSPQYLAYIHEYGINEGGTIVPARPVFKISMMHTNAKAPAIIDRAWQQFIGYGVTVFNSNKIGGKTDFDSTFARTLLSTKNAKSVRVGKIRRHGTDRFVFEWM